MAIVTRIAEVAHHFGVSEQSVSGWLRAGMPGTPSGRGASDGHFDTDEIAAWRAQRQAPRQADSGANNQARIRAALLALDLRERTAQLLDAQQVIGGWVRHVHEAKSQLEQLPARVLKRLPPEVSPELRRRIRKDVLGLVRRVCGVMEAFCRSEAGATEGNETGSDSKTTDHAPVAADG